MSTSVFPFPKLEPYNTGKLKVSEIHTLHYEQFGNPNGKPVILFHGGPGGGVAPYDHQVFDPDFYQINAIEQRGAGKSTPLAETRENTTAHLVQDMEQFRQERGIEKFVAAAGSWGVTLALAYGIEHPDNVQGMILRGVFLGTQDEIDWLYERGGTARHKPREYERFVSLLSAEERSNVVQSYSRLFQSDEEQTRLQAAKEWSRWELSISKLRVDPELVEKGDDPNFALAFGGIEHHYFTNACFMDYNYLLDNVGILSDVPTRIIHGEYDMVCQPQMAWELKEAMGVPNEHLVFTHAGHSGSEQKTIDAVVKASEDLKLIWD